MRVWLCVLCFFFVFLRSLCVMVACVDSVLFALFFLIVGVFGLV